MVDVALLSFKRSAPQSLMRVVMQVSSDCLSSSAYLDWWLVVSVGSRSSGRRGAHDGKKLSIHPWLPGR